MINLKKNFNEILNDNNTYNYTKELLQIIDDLSNNDNFINYIFYGPPCSYKYKSVLKLLQFYSPSKLKYEKKMYINLSKNDFYIKISDIHYEIDIENFVYNSKCLWNDIYNIIYNSISASTSKRGYIVFRNFDKINFDLLDLLYGYMQKELFSSIKIKYIIITECISFIPYKIINICKILSFQKLNKKNIIAICNKKNKKFIKNIACDSNDILNNNYNIENLLCKINNPNIFTYLDISNNIDYIEHHKSICENYIELLINNNYNIKIIRTLLYDILIYNLNSHECFFYIIKALIIRGLVDSKKITDLIYNSLIFFKNYNNNYRPIFHLESFTLYLIELVNEN